MQQLVFVIAFFALAMAYTQAQPAYALDAPQSVPDSLLVPETLQIGVPQATAGIAAISPGTTATLKKHSRLQARAALRRAKPWRPVLGPQSGDRQPRGIGAQAICGANRLVADDSLANCRIVVTYSNGQSFSCSAFKIADNFLGTAGHCIYSNANGGFAASVDVYCTGSIACSGEATTHGVNIATTPSWVASSTDVPTAWDGAVLKTAGSLPGPTLRLAMYGRTGSFPVKLTGYPAQNGSPGCESNAYQGACYQYSSTDSMDVTDNGMYSSSSLDLCSGHSGSGVMTADANSYVVAVVTGASYEPCANFFVPQINDDAGVDSHCEKAAGGVSFGCLARKISG